MSEEKKRDILYVEIKYNQNRTYKCSKTGKIITDSLEYEHKTTAIEGFTERVLSKLANTTKLPIYEDVPKIESREKRWIEIISMDVIKTLGKTTYKL